MALPLLVNGPECGPSNPLQGLTKRFDSDRGIQQDHFGATTRAGSSSSSSSAAAAARGAFRTQQPRVPGFDGEAAASFFGSATPALAPNAFDLSTLHNALPVPHLHNAPTAITTPALHLQHQHQPQQQSSQHPLQQSLRQHQQQQIQQQQQNSTLAWAADFMQLSASKPDLDVKPESFKQSAPTSTAVHSLPYQQQGAIQQWPAPFAGAYGLGLGQVHVPTVPFSAGPVSVPSAPVLQVDQSLWDREFLSLAASLEPVTQSSSVLPSQPQTVIESQPSVMTQEQQDELARTAGMLVESVRDEMASNAKFQNSQFLGLMCQLRDGAVVVDGNQMVEVQEAKSSSGTRNDVTTTVGAKTATTAAGWSSEFRAEGSGTSKGKERAVDLGFQAARNMGGGVGVIGSSSFIRGFAHQPQQPQQEQVMKEEQKAQDAPQGEDDIDAYLREENESYARYWREFHREPETVADGGRVVSVEEQAWDRLQSDWDQFEATSTGIRAIDEYQFQVNNPYLVGDSSRTRHHAMHAEGRAKGVYESVLELEAAVQHDPTNASAWFELGVKQQENEREQKALQALRQAVTLDPGHLPAWLALGISHTNDGNRSGTYTAIREWMRRNERYQDAVRAYWARVGGERGDGVGPTAEGFEGLVGCLIGMAQREAGGEVDADIQIALAVLLNMTEDYEKAQDCFRTALAVRPDDWLLYNRVGATMANSGRGEEALQYYYRALELNPAYIRARLNLGISCINLRRYEEAAHHILDALVLQDSDGAQDGAGGETSNALWDSLRTSCLHMRRMDLAAMCELRDVESFADAFHQ